MLSVSPRRSCFRWFLLWAAPLAWLGCGGGGGTDIVLPSLSVTTSTEGTELDPDGYSLVIDGSQIQAIGVAATLVVDRLADGQHVIELSGLSGNCAAQGENPQTVTVRAGATTSLSFAIRCSATSGTIEVASLTSGAGSDPDGFTLMLDGADRGPIAASATAVVGGIAPGSHSLGLAGISGNCQILGENPRPVTVSPGETAQVSFAITCTAATPSSGTLEITTTTSGPEPDPDGYSVSVDAGPGQPVGVNASLALPGISAARHSVQLTGVAPNCTVAGSNPRQATVPADGDVTVRFAVSCPTPQPGTGSIQITVATTGSSLDPDGYTVRVDNGSPQSVPVNGDIAVGGLSVGAHSVRLSGLASNCTLSGVNPQPVTVTAGQSATALFTIACAATGPGTGSIQVTTATTGSSLDPDGYTVSIDGGSAQPVGINSSRSLGGHSPGPHTVQLSGVAANCNVSGDNPRTAGVTAGQATTVAFVISCTTPSPSTGSLRVTVATSGGSPDSDGYTLSIDGAAPQSLTVNGSRTVQGLSGGAHSALLGGLAGNCSVTGNNPATVTVVAGQTATLAFSVSCVATGPSINLRIERMYLIQSTQRLTGDVSLVQDRDGYLRVFVTASGQNTVRPAVRVRFFRNGSSTPVQTFTIPAAGSSTPTAVQEGTLQSSWNTRIPAALIQPNTVVLADVDPDNAVAETNESDNSFPGSGNAQALQVQAAPPVRIRFVPILQTANNLQGSVGNPDQLMDLARRMYPLNTVITDVRDSFTVTGPLQPNNANQQWTDILYDLDALRVADGATDHIYYGLVRLDYASGMGGNGLLGAPAAMGTDNPANVRQVLAHELGHTWGQLHTPSCNPPQNTVDPNYPYAGGTIGVYGYDLSGGVLKAPSLPDIMGYCPNPWISDYTYQRVMNYRRANPLTAAVAALPQPSLLVWGHIANGKAVLEPSFLIVTRPHLPKAHGPYTVEARAADGSGMFALSFDATPVADDPQGSKHFAFAVPLDQVRASQLASLRLTGPGVQVAAVTQSAQRLRQGPASDQITARTESGGLTLQWDAAAHPMLMVRDPDTGEVLAFARGGNARVATGKRIVDLEVSNGVQSHRLRLAISR